MAITPPAPQNLDTHRPEGMEVVPAGDGPGYTVPIDPMEGLECDSCQ
ncbi:hypothetical protein ACFVUP_38040 [Streptomyces bacillaris]